MSSDSRLPSTPVDVALREIALPTPPRDGWPSLQAAIAGRKARVRPRMQRRNRWLAGLAVAASLGLVAVLLLPAQLEVPEHRTANTDPESINVAPASSDNTLDALIARSTELEAQLAWLEDEPRDGDALGVDLALIDRLQWVDQLLASEPGSADTAEVLWRERIQLLSRRLALSQGEALIASIDEPVMAPTL